MLHNVHEHVDRTRPKTIVLITAKFDKSRRHRLFTDELTRNQFHAARKVFTRCQFVNTQSFVHNVEDKDVVRRKLLPQSRERGRLNIAFKHAPLEG